MKIYQINAVNHEEHTYNQASVEWLSLLVRIQNMSGSNLGQQTGVLRFWWCFPVNPHNTWGYYINRP